MVTASNPKTAKVAAAKKTVSVKSTSPETETKLPVVKKTGVSKPKVDKAAATPTPVSDEQKVRYVEVAAFYIAERRGFATGNPTDDWLAAEAEVDRLISTGLISA